MINSGTHSLQLVTAILAIKQLLDEVQHDTMNYQNRGLCDLLKPEITQTRGFDNS